MAALFDEGRRIITKHLKNIFDSNELTMEQVCAKFAHTAEYAKRFAESEFEKYRVIQDKLFQSDFDRLTSGELPSFEKE